MVKLLREFSKTIQLTSLLALGHVTNLRAASRVGSFLKQNDIM